MSLENVEIVRRCYEALNQRDVDEFLDLGRDRVLTETHLIARGPGSGIPTTNYRAVIWKIRDGQIRRMKFFPDTRDALEAAGLRE
jgi:ketosteroid isomerase-like protein